MLIQIKAGPVMDGLQPFQRCRTDPMVMTTLNLHTNDDYSSAQLKKFISPSLATQTDITEESAVIQRTGPHAHHVTCLGGFPNCRHISLKYNVIAPWVPAANKQLPQTSRAMAMGPQIEVLSGI